MIDSQGNIKKKNGNRSLHFTLRGLSDASTLLSFIFLIPGFFVYHYAVSLGMPASLGGYTGAATVFAMPFLMFSYLTKLLHKGRIQVIDILYFSVIIFMLISATLSAPYAKYDAVLREVYGEILISLSFFLLGKNYKYDTRGSINLVIITYLLMLFIYFVSTSAGVFQMGVESEEATYQSFAVLFFFCAVIAFVTSHELMKIPTLFTSLAVFFVNGARTEAALYLAIAVVLLFLHAGRTIKFFAILGTVAAVYWLFPLLDNFETNRINDLLHSGTGGSGAARAIQHRDALETIEKNPIMGDFASYRPGSYSHSVISAWVDFGLFGFIFYILMLFRSAFSGIAKWKLLLRDPLFFMAVIMVFGSIVAELFTKKYMYILTSISLGALSAQLDRVSRLTFSSKQ